MEQKEKILIIEDDMFLRNSLMNFLKHEGFLAESVGNGDSALELVKDNFYDLIVTDIKLQGEMDGLEIVAAINKIYSHKKSAVIVITGFIDPEIPVRAIRMGIDDFIYKPFDFQQLLHSIKRSFQIRSLEKQKNEYIEEIKRMKDELEKSNSQLENKVGERTKELFLLFEVGREIISSLKLDNVLDIIVKKTAEVLMVKICSILLCDDKGSQFYIAASRGLTETAVKETQLVLGEGVSGVVLRDKTPLLMSDVDSDPRFAGRNKENYYKGPFASVPLIVNDTARGVININCPCSKKEFDSDDLDFLKGVADHAVIAIENGRLYTNLEKVYLETITALTSIIEMKDHYTKHHCERVTIYAIAIAQALKLSQSEIELLRSACQLHDLGKISVDEKILTKPGKLTEEEWREIRMHPVKGAELLRPLTLLGGIVSLVEQHHERYDGKGYPAGYKGNQIKLGARIMAVADSFDAMTTSRPYAKSLTLDEALAEMERCRDTQFDPEIVDVFIKLVKDNPALFDNR